MALPSAKAYEPIVCRLVADSYGQKEPCIKWRPRSPGKGAFLKAATCGPVQSCPWVGLTHGLGWVGSNFSSFWSVGFGWVHYSKSTKILKGLC